MKKGEKGGGRNRFLGNASPAVLTLAFTLPLFSFCHAPYGPKKRRRRREGKRGGKRPCPPFRPRHIVVFRSRSMSYVFDNERREEREEGKKRGEEGEVTLSGKNHVITVFDRVLVKGTDRKKGKGGPRLAANDRRGFSALVNAAGAVHEKAEGSGERKETPRSTGSPRRLPFSSSGRPLPSREKGGEGGGKKKEEEERSPAPVYPSSLHLACRSRREEKRECPSLCKLARPDAERIFVEISGAPRPLVREKKERRGFSLIERGGGKGERKERLLRAGCSGERTSSCFSSIPRFHFAVREGRKRKRGERKRGEGEISLSGPAIFFSYFF